MKSCKQIEFCWPYMYLIFQVVQFETYMSIDYLYMYVAVLC